MTDMTDRAAIGALGISLMAIRLPGEDIMVGAGACAPDADCPNGFMTATVRRGSFVETSEAVHLQDAIYSARSKLTAAEAKRRKAAEEAKAKASAA